MQADVDTGIAPPVFLQHPWQGLDGHRRQHGDAQRTTLQMQLLMRVVHGVVHVTQQAASLLEKTQAGGGQLHAARVARQQRQAEGVFEFAQAVAECRLRQVNLLGGATETAVFGNQDEGLKLAKADVHGSATYKIPLSIHITFRIHN